MTSPDRSLAPSPATWHHSGMGERFIDRLLEHMQPDAAAAETTARHLHVKTALRLAQDKREHALVLAGLRRVHRAAARVLRAAARVLCLGFRGDRPALPWGL